ncbi:unnamed protein product [Adineta steineri]|uniref:Arrestin C-terminal-like domain-containing protein n=1 Tax=Adineta steineri TaxID=433720 RepID=A0A815EAB4_9BILA|nr:unnamed protein product [Adineta steineri]CAF4017409.1 unnamed protein product [Adineta steineri]
MGSNYSLLTSNISIEFLNENSNIYETGQNINGFIEFNDDDDNNNQIEHIIIELIGELVYTNYRRKGRSTLVTTHQVPFFIQIINLNMKKQEKKLNFNFYLNEYLPSSFEQNHFQGSYIHYFIRIRSLDNHLKKDFPIIIKRSLEIVQGKFLEIENKNLDNIQLKFILKNNLAFIGQHLPFQIDLHNPNHRTIHRISLTLIQLRKLGPIKEERTIILKENLINFNKFQDEHYSQHFQIHIPYGINSSCSYFIPNKSFQWLIFVQYEIYIKVHIRGINKNTSLTIPIVINHKTDVTLPSNYDSQSIV